MKKIFRKEVIIGICVLVALAILILGIDFLKGVNVFKPTNYYYASFENVEGLAVSSPVMLNGFKVGQVREMEYEFDNPGHVLVEMSLDSRLKVPQGSKAVLGTDILGTASIVLHLSKSNDRPQCRRPSYRRKLFIAPGICRRYASCRAADISQNRHSAHQP